jgi:dTMP kinase
MIQRSIPAPFFVVFEGLDGSGKSTCARLLAERTGALYLTTPSAAVRKVRDQVIDSFEGAQEAAQLFYLATVFDASARVGRLLASDQSVVVDRYFLSTQAYAAFRGSTLELDALQACLTKPDLTVFLHAPLDVRTARLTKRGTSAADRETLGSEANRRLCAEHSRRRHLGVVGRWMEIDVAERSPEQVIETVLDALS